MKTYDPKRIFQDLESCLNLATKDTHKLAGAMFSAKENAPTRDRYLELVRGIAENDFPYWRGRLNYFFRAIRGLVKGATRMQKPTKRRQASGRRTRKAGGS